MLQLFLLEHLGFCILGFLFYHQKLITFTGWFALMVISGIFVWMDKLLLFILPVFMFGSTTLFTKLKSVHEELDTVSEKSGPRDHIQALANLGVGVFLVIMYSASHDPIFFIGFAGSIAASTADSWASEIGMLSRKTPVSIINLKPLPKGVSGGITILGLYAGAAGSLFIAGISAVIMHENFSNYYLLKIFFSVGVSGISGCVFDSYLGAKVQRLFKHSNTENLTEIYSTRVNLVKGKMWMNNDAVNAFTTLFGAALAMLLFYCVDYLF